MTTPPEELEKENASLRERVKELEKGIKRVKLELDACSWICQQCGADPSMKDTDLYIHVEELLSKEPKSAKEKERSTLLPF